MRFLIVAIASAIYFFINRSRRKKLVAGIDNDPRLAGSFDATTIDFPPPPEQSRWSYGWLWAGVIVAFVGLLMLIEGSGGVAITGTALIVAGLGLAVYDFIYGLSKSEPEDDLVRVEFGFGRVVLFRRLTGQTVRTFDPRTGVTVDCREITEKSFGADALKGYGIFMCLSEPACEIPLEFAGAVEFLGYCRHQGSPVTFSSTAPEWFKAKLAAHPSWQPGYFQ